MGTDDQDSVGELMGVAAHDQSVECVRTDLTEVSGPVLGLRLRSRVPVGGCR